MNITITDKAKEMLAAKLGSEEYLRITITEGGCAGLTYKADISTELLPGEELILQREGIRIVSDMASARYLDGLIIDYSDDLIGGGLRFTNANTQRTCGCGASFSLSGFPVIDSGKCCS